MSFPASLIKATNKIFKKSSHPLNLQNDGKMSYGEWQYEKAEETLSYYRKKYPTHRMFENKRVLDLGCGAGGKAVYYATLGAEEVIGVDILPKYEKEAMSLAKAHGVEKKFHFYCADAENLPYPDNSFDTIIMNDAMEHIKNPEAVISECMRLLNDGGLLFINFPPYCHPYGAHLSDAINMPWVHLFFSERACIEAYTDLVKDLPDGKERLNLRISCDSRGREYISYINKMTIKKFRRILNKLGLTPEFYTETPLRKGLTPLAKIPFTKEPFVKTVTCVINKKGEGAKKDI